MKVVFLHRLWPVYGGGETVTICLANEMVKRGIDVHVAYFKDSDINLSRTFVDGRLKLHKIDVNYDECASDFWVSREKSKVVSSELIKIVNAENIDIVHNQWWPMEFVDGIHQQTKARIVKCLHMDVDIKRTFDFKGLKGLLLKQFYPMYRWLEKSKNLYRVNKYYKGCDKLVFLAPCFQRAYAQMTGKSYNDVKLDFVYNPLVYSASISEKEYQQKSKIVLVVGRLSERHKKISRVLEAWRYVEANEKLKDWKLQIVGDGESVELYEKIIASWHLKRVYMEGYQQPLEYYKRAQIFLMTSAYEGFPMTLIEAQQNGVTVLAMDSYASIHEIITDGDNGILVPDGDIDSFIKKMVDLMLDEKLRDRLSYRGLQTCRRFFVEEVVDKWEQLYRNLIN